VSEDLRARWSRPIPNEALTRALVPDPDAPWSVIVHFASTLDGYEIAGASPTELMAVARPIHAAFVERAELPGDLTALRVALFAEQRRDHFSDSASLAETMRYIHALVEAIRRQLIA
jgi:hypothetical protein